MRGIDHLVLACRDLDAAATRYRALGFQVGARNRHPWGTENHIVQFDGTFLELIAFGADARSMGENVPFAASLDRYLAVREGFATLVLDSRDATADQAAFAAQGLAAYPAPFHFARQGTRGDGAKVEVAFTLSFARDPAVSEAGFFVCQQHHPENFWDPAAQRHPNGARGVSAVVFVARDPCDHVGFFEAFSGGAAVERDAGAVRIATSRGAIEIVTPRRFADDTGLAPERDEPHLAGFRVAVDALDPVEQALRASGVAARRHAASLIVAPIEAFGCTVTFAQHAADDVLAAAAVI